MAAWFNDPLREYRVDHYTGRPLGRIEVYASLYCAIRENGEKLKFEWFEDAVAWLRKEQHG